MTGRQATYPEDQRRGVRRGGSILALAALVGALALVGHASVSSAEAAAASAPGSLDTSFGAGGKVVTPIGSSLDEATDVALQDDGRIVVAGFSESGTGRRFALVRYNVDGSLDPSFDGDGKLVLAPIGTGARDEAYAVALQPDGKIVVVGDAYGADGFSHFAVVRLNRDGSLDPSFDGDGIATTTVGAKDTLRAVAIQGDGRIVVAGNSSPFTSGGGWSAVARYNPDGSLDPGFNDDDRVPTQPGVVVTDVGSSSVAFAVGVRGDGRIVIAGRTVAGNGEMLVIRYLPDGSGDGSFGPVGTSTPGVVITGPSTGTDTHTALDLLDDGRIITAGFAQVGGFQLTAVRYRSDGALDATFGGDGIVTTAVGSLSQGFGVKVDPEGRVLVAGEGTASSSRDFALVRYGSDGVLDDTFGTSGIVTTPFGTAVDGGRGLALQPDGRIVVAGVTDSGVNGSQDFALARYHGDPPVPAVVTLTPATDTNPVGTSHTVTATVLDADGSRLEDVFVRFSVTGSVTASGQCTTAASGECDFAYLGPEFPGADLVVAFADTDADGVHDADEPAGEASKSWVLPTSTPGQTSGGGNFQVGDDRIAFGFSARSGENGPRGSCRIVDRAADVMVECTDVTAFVISDNAVTVYGNALVNGIPTTYRIDAADNASRDRGADTFSIQTASGYTRFGMLAGGNVRVG